MSVFQQVQEYLMQLLKFISNKFKIPEGATLSCLFLLLCGMILGGEKKITSVQFMPAKVYQFQSPKYIGRDRVFLIEDENDTKIIHPQVDNNQIIINSLKNNTSDTISIKSNLFWEKYYYINKDSIFLINRHYGTIHLINSSNELIDSWQIPLVIDSVRYVIDITRQCDIVLKDSDLYLKVYGVKGKDYIYNFNIDMIYNLKSKKITKLFMNYPNTYSTTHNWSNSGSIFTRIIKSDDEIIYNFPAFEDIILYSLKNNSTKNIKLQNSKYIEEFPPPCFANNWKELGTEYIRTYWIDKPFYKQLIYDKYRNLFYRIVSHAQPLRDSLNNYNDNFTRNWSIMVFDDSFNYITEQFFQGRKYNPFYTFVAKEGLIIPFDDQYEKKNKGMMYQLFTIKTN